MFVRKYLLCAALLPLALSGGAHALEFTSYLGGDSDDNVRAVEPLPDGSSILVGKTLSDDFPTTPGVISESCNLNETCPDSFGFGDATVTRMSWDGSSTLFSTFLGGSAGDMAFDVAINSAGNIVVVGSTFSDDFPVTPNAFDGVYRGFQRQTGFIAIINPTGTDVLYATYFGGSSQDEIFSVALDAQDNIYIAGFTESNDFPTTPGAFETKFNNVDSAFNAFAAKFSADGTQLIYSTYLGGDDFDSAFAIEVDGSGRAWVGGQTQSDNFPVLQNAPDTTFEGLDEGFLVRLNAAGSDLEASTYLGGSSIDGIRDLGLRPDGTVAVIGSTNSSDFPVTPDAFDDSKSFNGDTGFAVFNADATKIEYATFVSNSSSARFNGFALDPAPDGTVYLLMSLSATGSFGDREPIYIQLDPDVAGEDGLGLDCRDCHNFSQGIPNDIEFAGNRLIMVGETDDESFDVTDGAFDTEYNALFDGFVISVSSPDIFSDNFEGNPLPGGK